MERKIKIAREKVKFSKEQNYELNQGSNRRIQGRKRQ